MILEAGLKRERDTVVEWLGIQRALPKRSNTAFTYIQIIRDGLKSKSVDSFIKHSSLTKKQVSRIIHISERTLQRNSPEKVIDISPAERLIELTRLFHKGIDVFNEKDKFILWLNRPNKSLDNQMPIELIETSLGMDLVIDELLKIEHGVFS